MKKETIIKLEDFPEEIKNLRRDEAERNGSPNFTGYEDLFKLLGDE